MAAIISIGVVRQSYEEKLSRQTMITAVSVLETKTEQIKMCTGALRQGNGISGLSDSLKCDIYMEPDKELRLSGEENIIVTPAPALHDGWNLVFFQNSSYLVYYEESVAAGLRADTLLYHLTKKYSAADISFGIYLPTGQLLLSSGPEYLPDYDEMREKIYKTQSHYSLETEDGVRIIFSSSEQGASGSTRSILCAFLGLSFIVLIISVVLSVDILGKIVANPLVRLTKATTRMAHGDLDVWIEEEDYKRNDEIGALSFNFRKMARSLKKYVDYYHGLAFTDDLTGLGNKTAYSSAKEMMENEIRDGSAEFAIIVMDVNNLKKINDSIGHEKGDFMLQRISDCLKETFLKIPVYRIGGDEFVAIIEHGNAKSYIRKLQNNVERSSREDYPILMVSYQIACGYSIYHAEKNDTFDSVFQRADKKMYENKQELKEKNKV